MKRAIVIGATSGIGRGLAEELAARGYRVGLVGRREALLREIAAAEAEKYGFTLDDRQVCQLSGEILLHQLIYPLPGLGRASTVIDLDVCVDAQGCGVVRDGRGPIDLCARMLYRAVHGGRMR